MYYQNNEEFILNEEPIYKKQTFFNKKQIQHISIFSLLIGLSLLLYSGTRTSNLVSLTATRTAFYYTDLEDDAIAELFSQFKSNFSKSYSTDDEEKMRYSNFKDFLYLIDVRNYNEYVNGSWSCTHGITKFADLSEDEFKTTYLGYISNDTINSDNNMTVISVPTYRGDKTIVDWSDTYTTPVKDQGYCGSCWAFSATEQIESDSIRAGLLTTDDLLSPEQIVQCDSVDAGCNGGDTQNAFNYVNVVGGLEYEYDYPYTSYYDKTGTCDSDSSKYVVTVDKYSIIEDEDSMISYTLSTGPISVCLAASTWSSYVSGIVSACDDNVDHCVQAVGINTEEGYWIVRNSWGVDWGNSGYIYLQSGVDMCAISYQPIYTEVSLSS